MKKILLSFAVIGLGTASAFATPTAEDMAAESRVPFAEAAASKESSLVQARLGAKPALAVANQQAGFTRRANPPRPVGSCGREPRIKLPEWARETLLIGLVAAFMGPIVGAAFYAGRNLRQNGFSVKSVMQSITSGVGVGLMAAAGVALAAPIIGPLAGGVLGAGIGAGVARAAISLFKRQ